MCLNMEVFKGRMTTLAGIGGVEARQAQPMIDYVPHNVFVQVILLFTTIYLVRTRMTGGDLFGYVSFNAQ